MKKWNRFLIVSHIFLLVLLYIVLIVPDKRSGVSGKPAFLVAVCIIEAFFIINLIRDKKKKCVNTGIFDIMILVWILLIVWELTTSVFNAAHPVLIPSPENVFDTFRLQWRKMLLNVAYSMQLLVAGFFSGWIPGILLGLIAGWIPRFKNIAYPIANVLAPIPAIVFSPYLVAIMPTFRSASVVVILLGVFWPTFLTTVNRVASIEPQILDSARMLVLDNRTMIFRILLPYIIPGVVSGLKVSVTTSLLMLNFAELMGATHGMGYYVQNSITYANYKHAAAGIIVIGIVVTILSKAVTVFQEHAVKWK